MQDPAPSGSPIPGNTSTPSGVRTSTVPPSLSGSDNTAVPSPPPNNGGGGDPVPPGVLTELAALGEFAGHVLEAWLDEFRLRTRRGVRTLIFGATLGLMLLVVAGATALITVVYFMQGAAGGLAAAAGGREWVGRLLVGALGVAAIGSACWWRETRSARRRLCERTRKYELRKARQRARFGRDVDDAAEERP